MQKKLTALAIVAGLILGHSAMAQEKNAPFGIYMGMPLSELDWISKNEKYGSYKLGKPPAPDPQLKQYSVTFTEAAGVCAVTAYTGGLSDEKASQIFEVLSQQMKDEERTEVVDKYRNNLAGAEGIDSLLVWIGNVLKLKSDHVQRIELRKIVSENNTRTVHLGYIFSNIHECRSRMPIYSKQYPADTEPSIR